MKYTEAEIKKVFDDFKDYTDKVISGEVSSFNTTGLGEPPYSEQYRPRMTFDYLMYKLHPEVAE